MEPKECESIGCWTQVVTLTFDLTHDLNLWLTRSNFWWPYFRNGEVDWLGMKEMWVGYNVGCTVGLLLGHSAQQIHWPSNGSVWNSDSFQPVVPWMGYSFTDLGAEGCCRSVNTLLIQYVCVKPVVNVDIQWMTVLADNILQFIAKSRSTYLLLLEGLFDVVEAYYLLPILMVFISH